jgi:triacylglycerol lipase
MPTAPAERLCDPEKPDMVAQLAPVQSPPYPLHHSVKNRLHPEYVAFYDKYILHAQPVYDLSIDVARISGGVPPSHSKPLPVGKTQDISIFRQETPGPNVPIRCFTPPGVPPRSGWPLVHFHHGGGWVFGDIDTENTVCTNICVRSRAVVITTDYRLAALRVPQFPKVSASPMATLSPQSLW